MSGFQTKHFTQWESICKSQIQKRDGLPRSNPNEYFYAYVRHCDIAHGSTAENILGRSTHPCQCLLPGFYRGRNLRWANVAPIVVQHGNHVVLPAGGCPNTALFCAMSCKQIFYRTIVWKQSAERPWPVLLVSPPLWTKSVCNSKGYGHLRAGHCINVKSWLQSWLQCAWTHPRPAHTRLPIWLISTFWLFPWVLAMSKVPLSNDLVAKAFPEFQWTIPQAS